MRDLFRRFACWTANACGAPSSFILAVLVIVVWGITGPLFHYSDTWQLVINTATTIITFLMVFLIQNTQNRDAKAMHLKLDELIRAVSKARDDLVDLESADDETLEHLKSEFTRMRERIEARHGHNGATPLPEDAPK